MQRTVWVCLLWLPAALILAGCSLLGGNDNPGGGEPTPGDGATTGTIIISMETLPANQAGSFTVTGVPSGTLTTESTLVVSDLEPGTYTTTEIDPAPDFDVTAVRCDDEGQGLPSSGEAQTRTAVINLDAGETVTCTFTNSQRGTLVVASRTEPAAVGGQVQFTGIPSGTISAVDGTLVAANLKPGTYTTTEVDPAPTFDLTAISCDDAASPLASIGDPAARTAIFNLDPGELVTCTFVNTRRGAAVIAVDVDVPDEDVTFQFTGAPSGTISANGTLAVTDLAPGTYTSTQVDPTPDFQLTAVTCDDSSSVSVSSGDPQTRSAIFQIDPGETVICTFQNEKGDTGTSVGGSGGAGGDGDTGDGGESTGGDGGINPFVDPDPDFGQFPSPDEIPPDAGTFAAPRPGTWSATNFAGQMACGGNVLGIPASAPETGTMEVLDGGATVIGTGLAEGVSITMNADPAITGRYTGSFEGTKQGVPVTINYFWQVVTDEYVVGYLTSEVTSEGIACSIYRPYELRYMGE